MNPDVGYAPILVGPTVYENLDCRVTRNESLEFVFYTNPVFTVTHKQLPDIVRHFATQPEAVSFADDLDGHA